MSVARGTAAPARLPAAGAPGRLALRLALAGAVSAFLLALLLRLLRPGGESPAAALAGALGNLAWPWIGAYVATQVLQVGLRAARYGLLLRASGERTLPPRGHLALVTMARNMFVDLLPGRSGELAFVALLNRVYGAAVATSLAALGLSVAFDFVGLGALLVAAGAGALALGGGAAGIAAAGAAVLGAAAAGTWILLRAAALVQGWGATGGALRRGAGRLAAAVAATREAGVFPRVLALTVGVRVAKYAGLLAVFLAATSHAFPALAAAPPWQILVALLGAEGAASLPLPTLMSFGAYEAGGAAGWALLGFDPADAAVATLAAHLCSQLVDYTLGGAGLALIALLGRRAGAAFAPPPLAAGGRTRLAGALAAGALAAAAFFALREWRDFSRRGAVAPPAPGEAASGAPAVPPGLAPLLGPRRGFVVWSSNRSGGHDLWRLELPSGRVARLTSHPHVDTHPRVSPDGTRVVFARSREPWVSLRDFGPWDAWVLDLVTGREEKVADFAYRPSWDGGGAILFQRRATQVVRRDLATGAEAVLAGDGRGGLPRGAILGDPGLEPGGARLAVTVRGAARMTALLGAGDVRRVGGGCQLAWFPDGRSLVLVEEEGRMGTSFSRVDPASLRREPLLDAPAPFSHEYFPAPSPDGRFLAYGASAGGHEHDTADYEIFLWRVGDPPEAAVRLTHHTGNDSWPDVFVGGE